MKKNQSIQPTGLDNLIGWFSPKAQKERMIARTQIEILQSRNANSVVLNTANKVSKSINKQISGKIPVLREDVRDVLRGSPFAKKGLDVIVNAVVGWGIEPIISHKDEATLEKVREEWKRWAGGLCSVDGFSDFYSLQHQAFQGVVADGEILFKEVIDPTRKCVSLQILESDYIADQASEINFTTDQQKLGVKKIINGVAINEFGKPVFYFLYTSHPGDNEVPKVEVVPADKLIHPFRLERPGQVRGISWFHSVTYTFRHLQHLQDAHLQRMILASSVTGVITQDPSLANPSDLVRQREADDTLSAGSFKHMNPGEDVKFNTIPNADGFDGSTKLALREAAAGLGVTYEALSNDLERTSFSSGRLGDLQFRANVDQWRWHLMVPRFLNPAWDKFKKHCVMNGIKVDGVEVSWTPPARQMIDPVAEVKATHDAIRSGLQTYEGALRELGYDPESHVKEIKSSNDMLDKYGIILDSDPRKTGNQQLQSPDSLNALDKNKASTGGEENK